MRAALAAALLAATPALAASPSGVTGVTIAGTQQLGRFAGTEWVRRWGTVSGLVAPDEKVEGLAALPKNADGDYAYIAPFELIAPARDGAADTVLVEAENRGSPLVLNDLDGLSASGAPATAVYPPGLGNGFLQKSGIAYARVAWQTGLSPSVPKNAEGVGEVIMRDFARSLGGEGAYTLGHFRTRLLGGISQSAWFVDSFIAEGFNADPSGGFPVFAGALAVDGTGNWLALNRLAASAHAEEAPYFAPDATVLPARTLLRRPKSDPFYIDVANYTDFYRVHASLTDTAKLPPRMRRYDWPGPHHPVTAAADAAATFAPTRAGGPCNGGTVVPLNPVSYNPYLRTLVLELARAVGSGAAAHAPALPPTTLFRLGPPPVDPAHFNPLPGSRLEVPRVDAGAEPVGGVRFPQVVAPLGAPTPVSLPPVITSAITGVCGNIGEWRPASAAEVRRRYGTRAAFLRRYGEAIDRLVAARYLLAGQRAAMLQAAASAYAAASGS